MSSVGSIPNASQRAGRDELRRLIGSVVETSATAASSESSVASAKVLATRHRKIIGVIALSLLALGAAAWVKNDRTHEGTVSVASPTTESQSAPPAAPTPSSSTEGLDASGHLTASRRATVSSETTGRLAAVLVEEGARVHKGQLLAKLESKDAELQVRLAEAQVASARLAVQRAEVEVAEAKEKLARLQALHAQRFVSDNDIKVAEFGLSKSQAAATTAVNDVVVAERRLAIQQRFLEDTEIIAPFDGLVIERAAQVGEIVSPISAGGGFTRTGICTIVDVNSMTANVRVNEKYIGRVHEGQRVTVVPRAYPDMHLAGRVATVVPALERETASIEVIVELLQHDSRVLPNMSVDVSFAAEDPVARTPPAVLGSNQ